MTNSLATFKPALILHGGAGGYQRSKLPPDLYNAYHASLQSYLRSTHAFLKDGGSALDAAVHAVSLMEDDELFNCGRGSVFTTAGTIEMEASVMVTSVRDDDQPASTFKRGAGVMGVRNVRHPIRLARESLLRTGNSVDGQPVGDGGSMHSQLAGPYVETLAHDWGLEFKPDEWFWTQRRWDEHRRGLEGLDQPIDLSQGTVGCVCLDQWGNLAVATSTGGLTNKLPGRIGDTPTLGAGFWAESWAEILKSEECDSISGFSPMSFVEAAKDWLGDCLPPPLRLDSSRDDPACSRTMQKTSHQSSLSSEKQSLLYQIPIKPRTRKRAIAVSGTGNGDSFLRVAAARTTAAMLRFSAPGQFPNSLADAVSAVAGPNGELQCSAGPRWGITGEGEGGIIGIEIESPAEDGNGSPCHGKVVFDFNSGGMWRAYIEEDGCGNEIERIMVFRDEYC